MTTLVLGSRLGPSINLPSAGTILGHVASLVRLQVRTGSTLRERLVHDSIGTLVAGYREAAAVDDAEASPPNAAALDQAIKLIESLPTMLPRPHPLFEASGAIALQWDVGNDRFFVVAFDGSGHIDYSAILGLGDEHYGRAPFKGQLPDHAAALLGKLIAA